MMRCRSMHTANLFKGINFGLSRWHQAWPVLHRKRLQVPSQDGHREYTSDEQACVRLLRPTATPFYDGLAWQHLPPAPVWRRLLARPTCSRRAFHTRDVLSGLRPARRASDGGSAASGRP